MENFIGLRPLPLLPQGEDLNLVKHNYLLYDTIATPNLPSMIDFYQELANKSIKYKDEFTNFVENVKYLESKKILVDTSSLITDFEKLNPNLKNIKNLETDRSLINMELKLNSFDFKHLGDLIENQDFKTFNEFNNLHCQYYTYVLTLKNEKTFVAPLLDSSDLDERIIDTKKINVYNVILENLLIPSSSNAWEDIIDFRNQKEIKEANLLLRNWVNEIKSKDIKKGELEDKILHLQNEYNKSTKLSKLKSTNSFISVFIIETATLAENLVKLKFKDLAKQAINFNKRKADLIDSELNSKGREISYLVKTNEFLKK